MKRLGIKRELMAEIQYRQVKYAGPIKKQNTLMKTILEVNIQGRRARG